MNMDWGHVESRWMFLQLSRMVMSCQIDSKVVYLAIAYRP